MSRSKLYYFVLGKDYSYCVPTRDLRSADPWNVKVQDEVNFKYGSQTFSGTVMFVSESEKEVLAEIKNEKKARNKVKLDTSFHADRPRKSALNQRMMMKGLQASSSGANKQNSTTNEEGGNLAQAKANLKLMKKHNKARAEQCTELGMLGLVRETPSEVEHDDKTLEEPVYQFDDKTSQGKSNEDSCSSVEAQPKVNKAEMKKDLADLMNLDRNGNESSGDEKVQSLESESDDIKTRKHSSSPVNVVNMKTEKKVDDLDSTLPITDNDSKEGNWDTGRQDYTEETEGGEDCLLDEPVGGRRKRSLSSSSESSTSSSYSSTSSSSSSSSSSSEDRKKKRKKKRDRKEKRKSKKSKRSKRSRKSRKHHKKRRVTKRVESSSSDSNDDLSEHDTKPKSTSVKRNLQIFPGQMYNYNEDSPDVVKVHPDHEVYISKTADENIMKEARSVPLLIKGFVKNVFTKSALHGSTAQGFPNRVLGSDKLKQDKVLPRLDPEGREAPGWKSCARFCQDFVWRPRQKNDK